MTNLVGRGRLLLLSLSTSSSFSPRSHLFGACGRPSRNGELRLILLRFNHLLQRVSCFSPSSPGVCVGEEGWWREKWSSTPPPHLSGRASEAGEMDISRHLHCPASVLICRCSAGMQHYFITLRLNGGVICSFPASPVSR